VLKLIKFAVVGGIGTLVNLALFFLMVDRGGLNPTVGAIICFAITVTLNYFLNHLWTFRAQVAGEKLSLVRYAKYVTVSLVGLATNLIILNLVLLFFDPTLKVIGQAIGIAAGMVVNFAGSNWFAFRKKTD